MKRLCVVTIIFCLIISCFIVPSFAANSGVVVFPADKTHVGFKYGDVNTDVYYTSTFTFYGYFVKGNNASSFEVCSVTSQSVSMSIFYDSNLFRTDTYNINTLDGTYNLYYSTTGRLIDNSSDQYILYNTRNEGLSAVRYYLDNPLPSYIKNPNVDEFISNTLISMGIRYGQYSDALNIASAAWDYIIDENNWYIGSGDRNDKDIKWNIDSAVSYANAQSNNYLDWYNGYKVNKDLTVALTKFISDNYTASGISQGTLAGYNVFYNSSYSYSGGGYGFGGSPSAYSFYPASTITYFNGAYLHDNNVIDQDEFVYTPADVRKFLGYPSSTGLIEPPDSSNGTGVISDGNGDTVYNIDLEWPSFDWLAAAIQSVLDFLDRLITTIADFLTQILDAILSLFSDAFESLTEFGEGIIEWLYAIVAGFSTIGGNYIPASLWAVILPFILINIGVGLIMFVMRSH